VLVEGGKKGGKRGKRQKKQGKGAKRTNGGKEGLSSKKEPECRVAEEVPPTLRKSRDLA